MKGAIVMGFKVTDIISTGKLKALFTDAPEYMTLYEEGADDLVQLVAVDEIAGEYAGFLSCTLPDFTFETEDTGFAMMHAYVAPEYRRCGVFTRLYRALCDIFEREYDLDETPVVVCPMDSEVFDCFKSSHFAPKLHSVECLYGTESTNTVIQHEGRVDRYSIEGSGIYDIYVDDISMSRKCYQAVDGNDAIIGELFVETFEKTACISDVWVAPEYRQHGVATNLVCYALNDYYSYKKNENHSVLLHVTGSNGSAISLYKKCGFIELERISYYEMGISG
jgi:ribosomal protein S18 acetylase RimI-like enzyme